MERRAWTFAIVLAGLAAGPAMAHAGSRLAPADEYFGRAKMSPLEITNRIHDAERGRASYAGLMTTQAAIEDWTRKYPGDPWIPSREYQMSHLFASLHSSQGNAEATYCRSFLHAHFAGTSYAVAAQREAPRSVARVPAKRNVARTPAKRSVARTPAKRSVAKVSTKKHHRFLGIF